jgi:hypothetical protein
MLLYSTRLQGHREKEADVMAVGWKVVVRNHKEREERFATKCTVSKDKMKKFMHLKKRCGCHTMWQLNPFT